MCAPCLFYLKTHPLLFNLLHLQSLLFPLHHCHLRRSCLLDNWPNVGSVNGCNAIDDSPRLHPNLLHCPSLLDNWANVAATNVNSYIDNNSTSQWINLIGPIVLHHLPRAVALHPVVFLSTLLQEPPPPSVPHNRSRSSAHPL